MIIYKIVKEDHCISTSQHYTSFGIAAIDSISGNQCEYVEDVFLDYDTAKEYISVFNEEQLDLIHLYDVIDDILHLCL